MRVSVKMSVLHSLTFCLFVSAMQLPISLDLLNKDGFNYYKDYLRGKSDDIPEIMDPEDHERVLYFYRTPVQLHLPSIVDTTLDQEFGKRTNQFKNHMLSKETGADGVTNIQKRVSKDVLSWMLTKRNDYMNDDKDVQDLAVGQIKFK